MKDLATGHVFSTGHGHAGVDSTIAYLHEVENELMAASRLACPLAWAVDVDPERLRPIPTVSEGRVTSRAALGEIGPRREVVGHACQLGVAQRIKLLGFVLADQRFISIASAMRVSESAVDQTVSELVQVLATRGLARQSADTDRLSRCVALTPMALWARAALQPKHAPVVEHLDNLLGSNDLKAMRLAWIAWLECRHGDHLGLTSGRAGARLVQFLLDAGIQKGSLATVSDSNAAPLAETVLTFSLGCQVPVEPHASRPPHRLFLTEAGIPARSARAASVSMVGLHWIFLVLGSLLLSKGEI